MRLSKATVFCLLNSLEELNAAECVDNKGCRPGCFLVKLGRGGIVRNAGYRRNIPLDEKADALALRFVQ